MSRHRCPNCKGRGYVERFTGRRASCRICTGTGRVEIDVDRIRQAVLSTQGPNRGKIRVADNGMFDVYGARYVWRLARFHGGEDTSMPVMAYYHIGCGGLRSKESDEVLAVLDPLVRELAREHFGTDLAAAAAWSGVL